MSTVLDETKNEGQVMSPVGIVTMILDAVQYTGKSVLTKTIMEPSFGKGAFLLEIVSRIIHEGKDEGKSAEEIRDIIQSHVYGIEKDKKLYDETVQKLNELLIAHDIPLPSWSNLRCGDTLLIYQDYIGKMDICSVNPPYFRIQRISTAYRNIIKNLQFTEGTIDLYIVFYEIGIQMLKEESGRLAYITPNSFLRNASQKKFRNYLVDQRLLAAIYDFKDSRLFDADTYTCICVLDKNAERTTKDVVEYREYNMYKMTVSNVIQYDYFRNQLRDSAWNLSSENDIEYLQQNAKRPIKIKNIAIVQNGIVTNRNSVYVGRAWLDRNCIKPYTGKHTDKKKIVWFNGSQMPRSLYGSGHLTFLSAFRHLFLLMIIGYHRIA